MARHDDELHAIVQGDPLVRRYVYAADDCVNVLGGGNGATTIRAAANYAHAASSSRVTTTSSGRSTPTVRRRLSKISRATACISARVTRSNCVGASNNFSQSPWNTSYSPSS